ncbi:MAG TPA: gas vesicle protein GvpJ [Propionibacteriaceae bacterium]|nr:gas vesicle protein GvpJ [Propionibacteriaceae bacterium]
MSVSAQRANTTNRYMDRPSPSSLADVIEIILDKGLVIDIYIRVSLVGIELLTIDARIVIASVDTYLRFARAVNRLDLTETETHGIPELIEDISNSGSKGKTSGALEGAAQSISNVFKGDDDDDDKGQHQEQRRTSKSSNSQGGQEKRTEDS